MLRLLSIGLALGAVVSTTAQSLSPAQLQPLLGTWRGELVYMDYSTGAETHIPADLVVEPLGERTWLVGFGYADEPHTNQRDTMRLSTDGTLLDAMQVITVHQPATDSLILVLQENGTDNDTAAVIRKIWTIGPRTCTLRKLVSIPTISTNPFTLRHEYRFTREK